MKLIKKKADFFTQNGKVREIFTGLYPGENSTRKFAEYQSRKYQAAVMMIGIGVVMAAIVFIAGRLENRLMEGNILPRNECGEGSYFVTLSASTEAGSKVLTFEVKERQYTEQEILKLKDEALIQLGQVMVGNNQGLDQVRENLHLVSTINEYPFSVSWRSSNYQRLRTDGTVMLEELSEEGEEVTLTAILSYEQLKWEEEFTVRLLPELLNEEQQYVNSLQKLLAQNDELYRANDKYYLPESIGSQEILWKEKKVENSIWFLFLGFAGALLILWGMDRDIQKKNKKRKEELERNYPDFVSKLQLYMGAGLTIKNAFLKLGRDYQKQKGKSGKKLYLYEEVLISDYQFSNGRAEDWIYQEWGKRCGEMHCRRLGLLLSTYLKQGNDKIISMLSEEMESALEERRNRARRQGEEVGTKLLLPMMLMLIVVMFLILLPAFVDFSGI